MAQRKPLTVKELFMQLASLHGTSIDHEPNGDVEVWLQTDMEGDADGRPIVGVKLAYAYNIDDDGAWVSPLKLPGSRPIVYLEHDPDFLESFEDDDLDDEEGNDDDDDDDE